MKPTDIDEMTTDERCREFSRIKNLYGEYARRHQFKAALIWVREVSPDGTGEHMHMLCHIPKRQLQDFLANALKWRPIPGEVDARKASHQQSKGRDGRWGSASLYISKQMTQQSCYERPLRRQKGGAITGKRWNCSAILKPPKRPL